MTGIEEIVASALKDWIFPIGLFGAATVFVTWQNKRMYGNGKPAPAPAPAADNAPVIALLEKHRRESHEEHTYLRDKVDGMDEKLDNVDKRVVYLEAVQRERAAGAVRTRSADNRPDALHWKGGE